MDTAGSHVNAAAVPQLPVCEPGIVEYHMLASVSNIQDVDNAAVATTLPQEKKEPSNHESQIFVGTIALNVNLASDSVEEVKRLSAPAMVIARTGDHALSDLLSEPMTCDDTVPGKQPQDAKTVQVLTEFGSRILHGVLTWILNAHRAGLAFGGACGMDNLRVHVYKGATGPLVVSRVYVRDDGGTSSSSSSSSSSLVPLDDKSQKADYKTLLQVITVLFRDDKSKKALHVGSIYKLLEVLAADDNKEEDDTAGSVITKGLLVDQPVKRTQLLQAYAAMISSPVAVATMCFNLKRFYDQLDGDHLKTTFADALRDAQHKSRLLCEEVGNQPLFKNVYKYPPSYNPPFYKNNNSSGSGNVDRSVPDNQYEGGRTGMGLLNFARNWFTHVPEERWDAGTENFKGLPELEYIFTYHFPEFIPQALLHLYNKFDDDHSNLLTRVLFL